MSREKVLAHVLQSGTLPTLSNVASKLITLTSREETTLSEITNLISHDVSLSAKVLKVVNSSFYSFPNEVSTIQQAVAILGINAIRSLVLSFSFLGMERVSSSSGFDYQNFWEKSLATAVAARLIFKHVKSTIDPEEVFTAGLLHNIGVLILAQAYPDRYNIILKQAEKTKKPLYELEELRIGASHAYIGSMVAEHWNFPKSLSVPILYHADPDSYKDNDAERRKVIQTVHLAGLVSYIPYTDQPVEFADKFRTGAEKLLGLSRKAIDQVLETVSDEVAKAADYFGMDVNETPSIPEILHKANIELSLLNMSYEQINRELVNTKIALEKTNAELEAKNRYLESIANLDGLTEVFNHRYFQETCDKELNRATRSGRVLSLIIADLDRFKSINDFYGHLAGDYILREICRVWRKTLRDYDVLARYGGEEFAVLLPETDEEQAVVVAEKMRLAAMEHTFTKDGQRFSVTSSFGVATLKNVSEIDPRNIKDAKNQLFAQADEALYAAKRKGRNRVEVYALKNDKWYKKIKMPGAS